MWLPYNKFMKVSIKNLETKEVVATEMECQYSEEVKGFILPVELEEIIKVNTVFEMPDTYTVILKNETIEFTLIFENKTELTVFFASLPPLEVHEKRIVLVGKREEEIKFPKIEFPVEQKQVYSMYPTKDDLL